MDIEGGGSDRERWRRHPHSPESDAPGTTFTVALDPAPDEAGYAAGTELVLRAHLQYTPHFRWRATPLGDLFRQYLAIFLRVDEPESRVVVPSAEHEVVVFLGPQPPSDSLSSTGRYYNDGLGEAGWLGTGRHLLVATVDGTLSPPIRFRVLAPDRVPSGGWLESAHPTALDAALLPPADPGGHRTGEPVRLRGTVRPGRGLHHRSGGDVATHVQLVIVCVDELVEDVGRLLPRARAKIATLAEAAGAKIASAGDVTTFEVDLAQAAEIEKPGRWWALVTADGQLTGQLHFEVR